MISQAFAPSTPQEVKRVDTAIKNARPPILDKIFSPAKDIKFRIPKSKKARL